MNNLQDYINRHMGWGKDKDVDPRKLPRLLEDPAKEIEKKIVEELEKCKNKKSAILYRRV